MSFEGWFWLILDVVLIGWLIRCVHEPIVMPEDWTTRVATTEKPMEGDHAADQESP